jgi:hypothetical protein
MNPPIHRLGNFGQGSFPAKMKYIDASAANHDGDWRPLSTSIQNDWPSYRFTANRTRHQELSPGPITKMDKSAVA